MFGFLFGTTIGKYILFGTAIVIAAGLAYLWIFNQGVAAAATAAAVAAAETARRANKARSEVKPNDKKAIDNDEYNRDNQ